MYISSPLLIAEAGRSGTKDALFGTSAESVSLAPGISWTLLPSCLAEGSRQLLAVRTPGAGFDLGEKAMCPQVGFEC